MYIVSIFFYKHIPIFKICRFLQAAEMLKPSSTSTMDQDYVEYYPHILFLHNKAEVQDYLPRTLEMMKVS